MKSYFKFLNICIISLLFFLTACDPEDIINEITESEITAKSEIGAVLNKARTDFAQDAQLTLIYGYNVGTDGQVDLLKPTENAFVYTVQSDSEQTNEFYVPIFNSSPVKSPINFNSMLSLIKDNQAKNILGTVFGKLSAIHIGTSVYYDDSPAVLNKLLTRSDVTNFRTANTSSRIDMFLMPSKSIDSTVVNNAADWVVNFYGDSSSLVLWLHPGIVSGAIDVISD